MLPRNLKDTAMNFKGSPKATGRQRTAQMYIIENVMETFKKKNPVFGTIYHYWLPKIEGF